MDEFDAGHRRFFVPQSQIGEGELRIQGQDAWQIASVLRLRAGDIITALDGTGAACTARIAGVTKAVVTAEILRTDYPDTEPAVYVTLAQALPKGAKLELVVQKACELGISEVIGLISERTVCRPAKDKLPERVDRWQRVAKEAAEQCGRARLPLVRGVIALDELSDEIPNYDLVVVAHEEEQTVLLGAVLERKRDAERVLFVVGPEGGLTEREVRMLQEKGAVPVSLGKRVLRAETAAIAGVAVIVNTLDGHL